MRLIRDSDLIMIMLMVACFEGEGTRFLASYNDIPLLHHFCPGELLSSKV